MTISEIGIPIDLSKGKYENTVYKDGKLQLVELQKSNTGKIVYASSGSWQSDMIYIADKIKAFEKIVKNTIINGTTSTFKIYTQSSIDGIEWSPYAEVGTDGSIQSPTNTYARIKIELFSSPTENLNFTVDEFNDDRYTNDYLNTSNDYLEMKRNYTLDYVKDSAWTEDGQLYRTTIDKSTWKKVDSLSSVQS
ncbi:hypothetical protein HFE03_07110 [Paenibacillus sp. EKM102P]|uniref:hypothetical protein n=1 Tax=unclassified Paenibacillus TaxID=185978 RepID=UPI00142D7956|nr:MULTISPECIES: hypothetical protein [unclassified Paenibacillus]KAF6620415.1 hypothetical protein HFE00_05015 [Paenibacillus sp. EKM101P]KAF6623407.1 hypothetical protein HFE03_07110 [Paenibacillus sp. EKM102P]KAF6634031.1 hypothetical protein HFE01_07400 [Paenibacillus sp. EKM10P]KAF6649557.1 hypothetical protein HFE02_02360 [Paenibacillus sp. EKM11P]